MGMIIYLWLFPVKAISKAIVRYLDPNTSDHVPILLEVSQPRRRRICSDLFNFWTSDDH